MTSGSYEALSSLPDSQSRDSSASPDQEPNMSSSAPKPDSLINHGASLKYWSSITPNVNGMLGGFPQISNIDLKGSQAFLAKMRRLYPSTRSSETEHTNPNAPKPKLNRAVDCGAGIGRITTNFLSKVATTIDIVEPIESFVSVLRNSDLNKPDPATGLKVLGNIYVTGLETWRPEHKYDLIWNQWCLGHLDDEQLVAYLRRCADALEEEGFIIVKENLNWEVLYDEIDSSVTRSDAAFRKIFAEAGLRVLRTEEQRGFPERLGLYEVRMYCLRPGK